MEIDQLVESLEFRFAAAGVDNAKRVAEELLAQEERRRQRDDEAVGDRAHDRQDDHAALPAGVVEEAEQTG